MAIERPRTALVSTDLQNDFMSPGGAAWGLMKDSLAANNTVENIEALLRAARDTATLRRSVASPAFVKRFGTPAWPAAYRPGDPLHRFLPFEHPFTKPTGCRIINGDAAQEPCVVEAFNSSYQIFVLIYPESELRVRLAV
jgi:hypothetical protein